MSSSNTLRRAVRSTLLMNAAAAIACAVTLPALAAEDPAIAEVIVTGSRIARPDVEATVPVQIISGELVQEQGSPNVADILAEIPAVGTATFSRTNSNFSSISNGISTINLRNMQDKRTLVLINGRRVVSGAGGTSTVDLNNIPTDLIQNVQVLTGGASAVYGSEAIAGVVNFILKDNFEGVHFRGQTGRSSEGDSERHLFSVTGGMNIGERGNVTANVQYDRDDGLRSKERAISANDVPFRSSVPPQGRFPVANGSNWTYSPDGVLQAGFDAAVNGFNRNAERYIAVPLERTLVTVLGNYELTDSVQAFFEGGYSDMQSNSRLEPFAASNSDFRLPDGTTSLGVQRDNPFLPAAIRADMIAHGVNAVPVVKRMNGVFDRSNQNDRTFYRGVIGLKGDLGSDWNWDVYYNQSQTKESTTSGTALRDRLYYALDAVDGGASGPVCRDVAARAAGCVPFNPFGFNSVSPEAANYVTAGGIQDTYDATIKQQVAAANITGPVLSLPAGELMVAAGVEYRKEKSTEIYSAVTQAGATLGNALSNAIGDYNVKEVYVETIVPLLTDAPFVRQLDFEAAFRLGDYSTVGSVNSWKAGMSWTPLQDIRFRAVYSRATRAPNIGELFAGPLQTFPGGGLSDPCNGTTAATPGAVADYCRSIPGIAQQIAANGSFRYDNNADGQSIEGFDRSNPNLHEEVAKTWTVGFVLTPQALRNFTMSVDWFQIKIDDAITLAPRQLTINDCVNSLGTSPSCALITRETVGTARPRTPGTVFNIDSPQINAASIETSGVDVAAGYAFDFANDQRLAFTLAYTYLDKLTLQQRSDLTPTNNKGQLNGDGRLGAGFEHRANLGVTYSIDRFSANWRVNYLGPIKDTLNENGPALDANENEVGSYAYHDAQLRYKFGGDEEYNVYLGVDNVFNKKPPLINQNGASNITGTETAADSYDPFGRFYYAGVSLDF
jgi:iron complex outermembrane recepter protein